MHAHIDKQPLSTETRTTPHKLYPTDSPPAIRCLLYLMSYRSEEEKQKNRTNVVTGRHAGQKSWGVRKTKRSDGGRQLSQHCCGATAMLLGIRDWRCTPVGREGTRWLMTVGDGMGVRRKPDGVQLQMARWSGGEMEPWQGSGSMRWGPAVRDTLPAALVWKRTSGTPGRPRSPARERTVARTGSESAPARRPRRTFRLGGKISEHFTRQRRRRW